MRLNLINVKMICFLIMLIFNVSASTFPNGPLVQFHLHNFVGGSGKTILKIQLEFSPVIPAYSTLLFAKKFPASSPNNSLSFYSHLNPKSSTNFDYQNANLGRKQTVQISGLSPGDSVSIYVVNFYNFSYNYNIATSQQLASTNLCQAGATPNPSNIYCSNCSPLQAYGAYCKEPIKTLDQNFEYYFIIGSGGYRALLIPGSTEQLNIHYQTSQTGTRIFLQFEQFDGEMAGFINHHTNGNTQLSEDIVYNTVAQSQGKDILIGVFNQDSSTITFNIGYTSPTAKTNLLVIVLGVLGGILFIALIIAICCIVKKIRTEEQIIHPRPEMVQPSRFSSPEHLTHEEIEQYFPSIAFGSLFITEEMSQMELNAKDSSNKKDDLDRDCVICLNPIENIQKIKVTYCRHMFHDHCLTQWFAKQRNCPYCREEYNKKATIQHYQKIIKKCGKTYLTGLQLSKEIFKDKLIKSKIQIQQINDYE